jgi:hypothetical protein
MATKSKPSRNRWLKTSHNEDREQPRRALTKNLIRPLSYKIAKASGFGDLLSHLLMRAGAQDGVDYGAVQAARGKPRLVLVYARRYPSKIGFWV